MYQPVHRKYFIRTRKWTLLNGWDRQECGTETMKRLRGDLGNAIETNKTVCAALVRTHFLPGPFAASSVPVGEN